MASNTINDMQTVAGNAEGSLLAGRYRIVRQLGQGGMGSVWLVEDTQLDDKPFAIKMLPSILVANKRAYRQLKGEALVAMRLVHPPQHRSDPCLRGEQRQPVPRDGLRRRPDP